MARPPKPGFDNTCPRCRRASGRPNGHRKTAARGIVQRLICFRCKRQWIFRAEVDVFGSKRLHLLPAKLLKSLALVVLGLPMRQVEEILRIKGETVKKWLKWCLDNDRWGLLADFLQSRFGILRADLELFQTVVVDFRDVDPSAFRAWAKEFGRRDAAERRAIRRLIDRIIRD